MIKNEVKSKLRHFRSPPSSFKTSQHQTLMNLKKWKIKKFEILIHCVCQNNNLLLRVAFHCQGNFGDKIERLYCCM